MAATEKKQLWLAITVLCLKTASSSFPKYSWASFWRPWSQCCHNTLRAGEHAGWDIGEMQLTPGRHVKCLRCSNKNCSCKISFFLFALVFWNISWLTVIWCAFEGFPLKRDIAVLLLPQKIRHQKNAFSALHFFYSHQHLVWHIRRLSNMCPISSIPCSPTECCLQNKSRGQVLIYLFTKWASQQQGVSSYCHIYKHRKW